LSQQAGPRQETETVSKARSDDVIIESHLSQMNVLYRRIRDVIDLRIDAVNEVTGWPK